MHRDIEPFRPETGGQVDAGIRGHIDIEDALARIAVKMTVLLHIRAEPRSPSRERDLPDQPALDQGIEAVVHRSHRDFRQFLLHPDKNFLCGGVVPFLEENRINMLALRRKPQTAAAQSLGEPAAIIGWVTLEHDEGI
jgi:hypothetical protein